MAFRTRSIRGRRKRRRIGEPFELQITSMMDILIIILVFLLKSYQTSTHSFSTLPGMQLPVSKSEDIPYDALHLIITPEALTFDNNRILEFVPTADSVGTPEPTYSFKKEDLDERGLRIVPLFDALVKAKEQAEVLRAKSAARDAEGKPLPFDGVLAIQADKRVSYEILRRVMYTAGAAGYTKFRFLAMKRET